MERTYERNKSPAGRVCCVCEVRFHAHVRLKNRQITCGAKKCQKKRHHQTLKKWRRANSGYQKRREYHEGFWKKYRRDHPQSTKRNRDQAKLRARLKRKSLQRNLDILQAAEFPKHSEAFTGFATLHQSSIKLAFGRDDSS